MKKFIYTIVLIVLTGATTYSQGNLQFNQVLNYQANASEPCGGPGDNFSYTVPAGKVWKVESFSVLRSNVNFANWYITLNGIVIWNSNDGGTKTILSIETPIWLQSSAVLNISFGNSASAGSCPLTVSGSFGISIIEFNVVP